ncbi:MAG: GntR family transcriptional regulator [Piscirickettsiaceae bacterium]|nr:MAG: GntR family transcriptional regulator [Piscirickettsiaceae bacterium]
MNEDIDSGTAGKLTLRLTVGLLMLLHGVAKIMHPGSLDFIGGSLSNIGMPATLAYGVYIGEVLAPLMIIIGYQARLGGLLVVVNMIVAIALVHSGEIFSLTKHGGWAIELQGFYLLGGLAVALLGSGRCAIRPD